MRPKPSDGFSGAPADIRDGFIHFSTAAQLAGHSCESTMPGMTDLLLVAVDAGALGEH